MDSGSLSIFNMTPFLQQIASLFYGAYGDDISRLAFVFPNQRAGLFFKKYLSEMTVRPLFSPTILTITDLFMQLSGKQQADRIGMLFRLYEIYIRKSGSIESFDEFLYWGEMLLNDFDDVDKYMANARMLFSNVTDLREIESDFGFLSEAQRAAIRSFWSSFSPKGDSANQEEFLAVWKILYELYDEFRQSLSREKKGYEGMLFREVVEHLKDEGTRPDLPYEKIVFVGLNALSVVEEALLTQLQKIGIADFYWDYASEKVRDPQNKACYFVARNLQQFPSLMELPAEEEVDSHIEVIGIPSGVGQAKQVYSLLAEIANDQGLDDETALRTAIILPDEHLLIPVLNSIPEEIRHINVTMGYPLNSTPVASLIDYILALQKNIRYIDQLPMFYFRDVLPILNHRYLSATNPLVILTLTTQIAEHNKIYIGTDDLKVTPLLDLIFTPVEKVEDLAGYLICVLEELNKVMAIEKEGETEEDDDSDQADKQTIRSHQLDQEFLFHYYTTVNRLKGLIAEAGIEMKTETFARLLKRTADTITIPFRGEPLSGLQIMGVLETRALDFDRLIILSMNEGVFPMRQSASSFIPYNLRKGFGLPTYEHQDSVWAYHFYRLINRASRISFLYDTRTNGIQTGEMSRFIHQLNYHYETPIEQKLVVYNVSSSKTPALEVKKSDEVRLLLNKYLEGGERAISASGINTYLDCPLKFYFSVVEGVQEEEEVAESIESSMFGSIVHKTMEDLYKPLCGKLVTADILQLIRKDSKLLTDTITRAFAHEFFKTKDKIRPLTGQNYLIGEMIRKYAKKILERDGKLTPFKYIESERKIKDTIRLDNGSVVQLKGFIDRVDEVRDMIRIIDYKSGKGLSVFPSIDCLFNKEEKERPKAVMQVFMYSWMYSRLSDGNGRRIQPGIYYMRNLFTPTFDSAVAHRIDRGKQERVEDFMDYSEEFEAGLRDCLNEIFDNHTPFIQTPTGKACVYCDFKNICGK